MSGPIPVSRKIETDLGSGQFQERFWEAVNSKYELSVESTSQSEDRINFQWQSVGSHLAMNPAVFVDFTLTVSGSGNLPESLMDMPVLRVYENKEQTAADGAADVSVVGYNSLLAFGPGDAISEAISSIQVVTNSCSVTSTERDKFWRSMMRAFIEQETMAKAYERSGGCPETFDAKACGVIVHGDVNGYGKTMESSLCRRAKQFISRSVPLVGAAHVWSKEIQVRWPVCCSLLHPFAGKTGVYENSPFAKLPNAICNWSSGSIQILMRNMFSCLIRQYGRSTAHGDDSAALNRHRNNITVAFKTGVKPTLRIQFVRLNSFRKWPQGLAYSMYRTNTVLHEPLVAGTGGAFNLPLTTMDNDTQLVALPPVGRDFFGAAFAANGHNVVLDAANWRRSANLCYYNGALKYPIQFRSIQLPSIPEYLIIVAQRDNRQYSREHSVGADLQLRIYPFALTAASNGFAGAAAAMTAGREKSQAYHSRYRAQNSAANLCITKLDLEIQNGTSTFRFKTSSLDAIRDLDDLYEATCKNVVAGYMSGATQSDWENRCCCIVLHETQFQFGLASSQTIYPVSISIKAELQNRCRFTCGSQIGATHASQFPMIHLDPISSVPVVTALYTNGILDVTEGSAVLSAANQSVATLNEALSRSSEQYQL